MIETLLRLRDRIVAGVDGPLFAVAMLILAVGLATLFSASGENVARFGAQVFNIAVAIAVMWLTAQIPPQTLMRAAVPVYAIGLLLLVAVAVHGDVVNGARRWLNLGFTRVQPSELMKLATPLMLAWYFDQRTTALRLRDWLIAAVILGVPVLFIVRQPDLGTALLVAAAGCYVIFLAGLSWVVISGMLVAGLASLPLVWHVMHGYQRRRLLTLIDPSSDPLGSGYHIIQATIAVGSGGILGKGWLQGTQSHLDFIPERATDFIFAVFSEEFGLLGNTVLLVLYALLIGRGLMIALAAPTTFARLLAGGIVLTFFTYVFVNMGMVSGILPVVGVPLPLISYGGTSLVTLFLGIGMLMSIYRHRRLVQT